MNVFDLSRSVVGEYENFSRSFTKLASQDIKTQIDAEYASGRFWPEPTLQINPRFKTEGSMRQFVEQKLLHPGCNVVFKDWELRKHQAEAGRSRLLRYAGERLFRCRVRLTFLTHL
jgi:hypothetical protein